MIQTLNRYVEDFGRRGIVFAALSWLSKYTKEPLTVSVPTRLGKRERVLIRPRTTDIVVFKEIFRNAELQIELSKSPRTVIDAGAYTGLSSTYFAAQYPGARIVAVEPDGANFNLLLKNVRPFTNIIPIRATLWKEVAQLGLYDSSSDDASGEWAYQVRDSTSSGAKRDTVPAITVEKIMRDHDIGYIDLLKLDIEGAEKEVLEHSSTWIGKVGVLIVELHDRFRAGCKEAFDSATRDFAYREVRGEKIILMRKEFAPK